MNKATVWLYGVHYFTVTPGNSFNLKTITASNEAKVHVCNKGNVAEFFWNYGLKMKPSCVPRASPFTPDCKWLNWRRCSRVVARGFKPLFGCSDREVQWSLRDKRSDALFEKPLSTLHCRCSYFVRHEVPFLPRGLDYAFHLHCESGVVLPQKKFSIALTAHFDSFQILWS